MSSVSCATAPKTRGSVSITRLPCAIAPFYGRLTWLNRDGKQFPGASARAVVMQGAGDHYTWIDPELDAVVVLRWLDPAHTKATFARFGAALRG